jgi:5-methylthioribose kinase
MTWQKFEVEALRLVLKMHANDDVISVPAVYLFDEKAHVVIIEDCGMDARTLKQLVIDEALPQTVAEEIGVAIGRFLARIHAWNKEISFDMGIFTNNGAGKKMASFLLYDRLIPTLSGQNNIADLADPVLDIPKAKLDVISKLAQTRSHEINNNTAPESFTHSDFWPANIMVSLRRESDGGTPRLNKLYVLDWEMATVGLRGLDIGQFCGEMRLLQRFYPSRQKEASTIMKSFLSAYKVGRESDETLARVTVSHAGAYLAVWASLEQPGNREETRGAVAEGVDLLIGGAEGTRTWLEGSFVGDLVV